jgi:hypothetical protein|tara:strand:+ start:293 stop:460 length:168 start_codon:yes stop_codon:yes gene_type:complete
MNYIINRIIIVLDCGFGYIQVGLKLGCKERPGAISLVYHKKETNKATNPGKGIDP